MKYCFYKYNQDLKNGVSPSWNCYKWLHETRNIKSLKDKVKGSRSPKKKIYTGQRGGKYTIVNGRKRYI